jgi:hypothetical protein
MTHVTVTHITMTNVGMAAMSQVHSAQEQGSEAPQRAYGKTK